MDRVIQDKERELERLSVEEQIEGKRMSIEEKKAVERSMKAKYGRDWKKILGVLKVDREAMQSLYSMGLSAQELRNLNKPGGLRRMK